MLGERLQELRKDRGLSQLDLADKLMVSFHTISSYERERSMPNDEIKVKIAQLFDISIDYLLGLTDEQRSYRADGRTLHLPNGFTPQDRQEVECFIEFLEFKKQSLNQGGLPIR